MDGGHVLLNKDMILVIMFWFMALMARLDSKEMYFSGEKYLYYTPKRAGMLGQVSRNRIHLEFRTIHPSGLLVVMVGKGKDSLVLQMTEGRLRYITTRYPESQGELSLGRNLDDNQWHRVDIIRKGRLNQIHLDNVTKTLLSPLPFLDLSVNHTLYVGGVNKAYRAILPRSVAVMPMFTGCLNIHQVDDKRVRMFSRKPTLDKCSKDGVAPVSLRKLTSGIGIQMTGKPDIRANQTAKEFLLKMSVRSLHKDGRIVSIVQEGFRVEVVVVEKKVHLKLINNTMVLAKTMIASLLQVGTWHRLSIRITGKNISLSVNKESTWMLNMGNLSLSDPHRVVVGAPRDAADGLVGCIHDLNINNAPINLTSTPSTNFTYPYLLFKNEILPNCKRADKCSSNPCKNGGNCIPTGTNYTCECRDSNYYGKHCHIYKYKQTCAEFQKMGMTKDSYCLMDPDGEGGSPPITSLCKFDKKGRAYTSVHHNRMKEFPVKPGDYEFAKYYFHKITYDAEYGILKERSAECKQLVKFKCQNVVMFNAPQGPPNVGWESIQGEKLKHYWGGVTDGNSGCACGVNKTCSDKQKLCNCDRLSASWNEDAGYLVGKDTLPLTRLRVTGIEEGSAFVYVGPLVCFGSSKNATPIEKAPESVLKEVCLSIRNKKNKKSVVNHRNNNNNNNIRSDDVGNNSNNSFDKNNNKDSHNDNNNSNNPLTMNQQRSKSPNNSTISSLSASRFVDLREEGHLPEPKALPIKSRLRGPRKGKFPLLPGLIEYIFIALAGLAFLVIVLKVICYKTSCYVEDKGELILNSQRRSRDELLYRRGMSSDSSDTSVGGNGYVGNGVRVARNPLCAYWV